MSVIYWEEEMETLPRVGLESIQLRRLQHLVARVYRTVEPYRRKMDAAGVKPDDIKTLADLARLPFTVKQDLRDNYPFGLFTVPLEEVVRVHASSGTTGKSTVVGYTANDIKTWSNVMARALCCAGATKGDMVHNAYGYGLFTGGLGAHYGIERLGATVIPVSGGNTKRQIGIMKDFGSTVLLSTPSYALNLAEAMDSMDIDPKSLSLRVGIFGAEPWSENMREEVERKLNLKATDIYGLSEVMGPGVAQECLHTTQGMHIFEDHFLPEIIDPDTGEVLPPGEKGELVFTTLTISQMGNVLALRSDRESLFTIGLLSNRSLLGAVVLTFGLQMAVVYLPFMQRLFETSALSATDLAISLIVSTIPFSAVELQKLLARRREKRQGSPQEHGGEER